MKTWQQILLGTLFGLLCAAVIYLVASPPRGKPITLQPPPTPGPLVVHVTGAVAQPGVYMLPVESRISDAIQASGGLLPAANAAAVNLAARIRDGEKVVVAFQGEEPVAITASSKNPISNPGPVEAEANPPSFPININTASQTELETLPGIGPTRAADIVSYRESNGPFQTLEQLMEVPGIGEVTFERLKSLISVE